MKTATPVLNSFDTDLLVVATCAASAYPAGAFFLKATVAAAFAILAAFF
jgi:hypothetical protein